jgi:hypothetical protein
LVAMIKMRVSWIFGIVFSFTVCGDGGQPVRTRLVPDQAAGGT